MEHEHLTGHHHDIEFALHVLHSHTCGGPRFGPGAVDASLYLCQCRVEEMNEQQHGKYRMLMGFLENMRVQPQPEEEAGADTVPLPEPHPLPEAA